MKREFLHSFYYLQNTFLIRVFIKRDRCFNRKVDGLQFRSCQFNSSTVHIKNIDKERRINT